ncbi:MAG: DedA family protein [Actinobacteria bacterium]|nr:MAG: DedA family protein [Actinomycetota bacterium]
MTAIATTDAPIVLAALTSQLTSWIAHHGAYAVFALMGLDALLPVGGELIMLYAGALAAGAIAGQHPVLFGARLATGAESYLILAVTGALGYLAGSLVGWGIGVAGGRPLLERHGRWLHVSPQAFARAERWFERFGHRAVFLGRITPVVRSFISIPAGVLGSPIATYTALTLAGSLIWCFGFAGAGWALGGTWETVHHDFRYADYAVVAAVALFIGGAIVHRRGARKLGAGRR